jgi:hypothetical protein
MQLLKQRITSFTSSNITETVAAYNKTTTYAQGAEVRVGAYIYKSVTAGNLGNDPIETLNIYWSKWGVSNRNAMLDLSTSTKSVLVGGSLVVEFLQDRMDTIVLGNYEATTVKVEILDGTTVEWSYETEFSLNEGVEDWYTWTYLPYSYEVNRTLMVKLGFVDKNTTVRVTFTYDADVSDRTACGYLVGGSSVEMGKTLYGVGFKFNSFTSKEFDTFGTLNMVKRGVQDLVDFNTFINLNEKGLMTAKREIKEHYDTVVAFILDELQESRYENMITLGVIQDASVVLNNGVVADLAWSVQEVI